MSSIELREPIDATANVVPVVYRYRLGEEIVHVIRQRRTNRDGSATYEVLRGQEGTTASDHPAGTVLEPAD